MRLIIAALLLIGILATTFNNLPTNPSGNKVDEFDYYVLSLSWLPSWCAIDGDARGADQCDPKHDFGWTLHGLWPEFERGYPSYCKTSERAPSRDQTAGMVDIMGSSKLAQHEWEKHGTCSGLSAQDYFAASRRAYEAVIRPPLLRKLDHTVKMPAYVIEEAFLKSNPSWDANMITITCRQQRIQEARLCLTKDLTPRKCGPDVLLDCNTNFAIVDPVR